MKIIKPSYEIENEPDWEALLISLEKTIRTCYKSEEKMDVGTADKLIRSVILRGHESTLEHASMSVRFICDRGVSHELVRHRHCSFSQESTRYVDYSPDGKTNGEMQFILPNWISDSWEGTYNSVSETGDLSLADPRALIWFESCLFAQRDYDSLVGAGWKPEQARSVLPNSLKTEIVVTTNMRDWRHIFSLRCDKTAHPQMRELMVPLYCEVLSKCPTLFDSVQFKPDPEDYRKGETK